MAKGKLSKPTPVDVPAGQVITWEDLDFQTRWPLLYAHLADAAWDSGEERLTSTLLLFSDSGTLKACVHDRSAGRSAFFSGATFIILLNLIEQSLSDDSADWRSNMGKRRGG